MNIAPTPYNTGLCDCTLDCSSCMEAWCCRWCQFGHQYDMIFVQQPQMNIAVCCGAFCEVMWTGCGSLFASWYLRAEARRKYNIVADDCNEFLIAICCVPCSIAQVYREMSIRGFWPGGVCVSAPFVLPTIAAPPQQQMIYGAPPPQPQQKSVY